MTAGNDATLFFIGLMLIAVEWVRLSAWAAGLFIFGTVLNGVGAATGVDGITLVSFRDHAGRSGRPVRRDIRQTAHCRAHRGTARVNPFTTELPPT